MRWIPIAVCSVAFLGSALSVQAQPAPARASQHATAAKPLLPDSFAGWVSSEATKTVTDAAQADSTAAAALKEYDFTDGSFATYKRGSETLTLHALRFRDASGSYGAYSFYRQNGWPKESIGTGATSNHNRVLFWIGNLVVDANFSRVGPMSAAELRELAGQLPVPQGNRAVPPPVLSSLPQEALDHQTTHYALGPAGYTSAGGVLPASLVGFDRGAEAVTANYSLRSGPATLTIIDYPTPQLAAAQEAQIRAYIKAGSSAQPAWPKPLTESDLASLEVRRSGPLVALISGDAIPEESHKLLAQVHYAADLTSLPQSGESEVSKTGKLLWGVAVLVLVGAGAAVLLGLFLGGGRALYRISRGKPASSMYESEFISLNLNPRE